MSLRLGQYFSVEPDRRDPLYKPSLKIDSRPAPRPADRRHPAWSAALPAGPPDRQPPGPHEPPGPCQPPEPRSPPGRVSPTGRTRPPGSASRIPSCAPPRPEGSAPPSRLPGPAMSRPAGTPRAPFRSSRCPALPRRSSRRGIPNPDPKSPLACWVPRLWLGEQEVPEIRLGLRFCLCSL